MAIDWVVRHAESRWDHWFGSPPRRLRVAMLISKRHRARKATLLISNGFRAPELAVKIGWTPASRDAITHEFCVLETATSQLPEYVVNRIPTPYELVSRDGVRAMFTRALRGQRPRVPSLLDQPSRLGSGHLRRYLEAVTTWSAELADSTVTQEHDSTNATIEYMQRFPRFGDVLADLPEPLDRAWQHGDPSVGNVLLRGRETQLLDWEYASPWKMPWHDAGYLVLFLATLAARQSGLSPPEALDLLYDANSWSGVEIRDHVKASWPHSIAIPHGVILTCVELAVTLRASPAPFSELSEHLLSGAGPKWLRI